MKTLKERAEDVLKGLREDIPENRELYLSEAVGLLQELVDAPPAPSVPDGWRQFLTDVITAAGLLKYGKRDKGLAGRIGKFAFDAMRAATTPAEPPADVARDAERYRWLRTHGLQRAWVSLGTDFEGDNFASFRCEFNLSEPPNLPYEDDEGLPWADKDFDAAIDAAMSEKGQS